MADIQYRDGGRGGRLPWTIALILAWAVFIVILLAVLSILAGDLGFAEAERILGFIPDSIFRLLDRACSHLAASLDSPIGMALKRYGALILGSAILLWVIWRVIVRGYWRLVLRPYVVLMTAIGCTAFCLISDRFPQVMETPLFSFIGDMFSHPLLVILSFIGSFGYGLPESAATHILHYGRSAYAYLVFLFIAVRVQIWLSPSSKLPRLGASRALDLCRDTLTEARRHTNSLPLRVKFYLSHDDSVNAFAFDNDKIALNTGLLVNDHEWIDEEIVRSIIAHELGHIAHHDVTANAIANANFMVFFFIILIPYYIGMGIFSSDGRKGRGPLSAIIAAILMLFFSIARTVMNGAHYLCYLVGGKRAEYAADRFAVKTGNGKGLLRFMIALSDVRSGGFSDPHPSMQSRALHLMKWMERSRSKAYDGIDFDALKERFAL